MYIRHFGLERRVFHQADHTKASIFLGGSRSKIMSDVSIGLMNCDAVIVLIGPSGIGKTTLGYAAAASIADRQSIACISSRPETSKELIELLLGEFGMSAQDLSRAESTQLWKQLVAEQIVREKRTVIIAEDAQTWPIEVLQRLHSITAADPNGYPGVNVVLTGSEALKEHIRNPEIESLRQRIRATGRIAPFTRDELREFVEKGIARAGGHKGRIFGPGSLELLHCYAKGIPRIGQNLCESALAIAAARQEPVVSARIIRDAAVDMHGLGNPNLSTRAAGLRKTRNSAHSRSHDAEIPTLKRALIVSSQRRTSPAKSKVGMSVDLRAPSSSTRSTGSPIEGTLGAEVVWALLVEDERGSFESSDLARATAYEDEDETVDELQPALTASSN